MHVWVCTMLSMVMLGQQRAGAESSDANISSRFKHIMEALNDLKNNKKRQTQVTIISGQREQNITGPMERLFLHR